MLLAVCLMIAALPLSVSAAGEYVPGNPRWSGYQNQVQWGRPAGAASGDSFEYEAQLLLGDDVVESKAVEIDTYLFFTNDVVTRPQEEYTIRVRARWIMIVGDPDGQYMVADVGEAEPPHEHSYTGTALAGVLLRRQKGCGGSQLRRMDGGWQYREPHLHRLRLRRDKGRRADVSHRGNHG